VEIDNGPYRGKGRRDDKNGDKRGKLTEGAKDGDTHKFNGVRRKKS